MDEHLNLFKCKGLDMVDLDDFLEEFMECNDIKEVHIGFTKNGFVMK